MPLLIIYVGLKIFLEKISSKSVREFLVQKIMIKDRDSIPKVNCLTKKSLQQLNEYLVYIYEVYIVQIFVYKKSVFV